VSSEEEAKKLALSRLSAAYKDVFADPKKEASTSVVLADLSGICRFYDGGFSENREWLRHLEGRREVFVHIKNMLNMTAEQVDWIVTRSAELTKRRERTYDPLRGE
jgi:hypothetical protein